MMTPLYTHVDFVQGPLIFSLYTLISKMKSIRERAGKGIQTTSCVLALCHEYSRICLEEHVTISDPFFCYM